MNARTEDERKHSSSEGELECSISSRLSALKGDKSLSRFAVKCGIGESLLRKYLAGSMPGIDKVVQIARKLNVSIGWLATGEGPMHQLVTAQHDEGADENIDKNRKNKELTANLIKADPGLIDRVLDRYIFDELIESAVEVAEEVFLKSGKSLPPHKKARYIRAAIDTYRKLPEEQRPTRASDLCLALLNIITSTQK